MDRVSSNLLEKPLRLVVDLPIFLSAQSFLLWESRFGVLVLKFSNPNDMGCLRELKVTTLSENEVGCF